MCCKHLAHYRPFGSLERESSCLVRNVCLPTLRVPVEASGEPRIPSTTVIPHTPYQYLVGGTQMLNNCRLVRDCQRVENYKCPFSHRYPLCVASTHLRLYVSVQALGSLLVSHSPFSCNFWHYLSPVSVPASPHGTTRISCLCYDAALSMT